MQRYMRIHEYAEKYLEWVYKTYSDFGPAYLCTYYNLDLPESIYDGGVLDGASYEKTGDLSGLKWRKILLLPVYNIEQIVPSYSGEEEGFTKKNQVSSFNFPTSYNLQPMPHDYIKFEQDILKPQNNEYPMYEVANLEKATNTDITFWKVNVKVSYRKETDLVPHLSRTSAFFGYTKKIYSLERATFLYNMLEKNRFLQDMNDYYQENSGVYTF